jgi:integrase
MTIKIRFFRGKRGGYSCRFFINRQRFFKSLKTDERKVAEVRAIEYKEQVMRKLKLGAYSLASLIDSYLFTNKERTMHDTDKHRLELLVDTMGDIPLLDLTKESCREFYLELTRKPSERTGKMLSENSKLSYLTTYKALMNFAINDGKLDFNPFNFFKKGQAPRYQKRERELTELEISMLSKALKKIYQDKNRSLQWRQFYCFFILLCYSGARPKEISHIKWSDFSVVDKERVKFIVSAEISKTNRMRRVEIPRWVWDEMTRMKKLPRYNSPDFVFDLKRREADVYGGSKWRRLCSEVGIDNAQLYDLRHSYISQRIREGANPVAVAEQVGHASTQMTLNNYSHSSDLDRKSLIEKIKKIR